MTADPNRARRHAPLPASLTAGTVVALRCAARTEDGDVVAIAFSCTRPRQVARPQTPAAARAMAAQAIGALPAGGDRRRCAPGSQRWSKIHQRSIDGRAPVRRQCTSGGRPNVAVQPGLFDRRAVREAEEIPGPITPCMRNTAKLEGLDARGGRGFPHARRRAGRVALKGISGSLASLDLLERLSADAGNTSRLRSVLAGAREALGPASTARQIVDLLVLPLFRELGLEAAVHRDAGDSIELSIATGGRALASPVGWRVECRPAPAPAGRRDGGIVAAEVWWIWANGVSVRLMDVSRADTQRTIDFDLDRIEEDDRALRILQRLFEGPIENPLSTLESLIERLRAAPGGCRPLAADRRRRGADATGQRLRRVDRDGAPWLLEAALADALTIVYRILFLLFAEARGARADLWHPVYRDSYSIGALHALAGRQTVRGLWPGACRRYRGWRTTAATPASLAVTAFNGQLFAPGAHAARRTSPHHQCDRRQRPRRPDDDSRERGAGRRCARLGRERITYADLGVEQLGTVYERVLDYAPSAAGGRDHRYMPYGPAQGRPGPSTRRAR